MKITSKDKTTSTDKAAKGEVIYELVGKAEDIGGTTNHSVAHIVIPKNKSSSAHYHKVSEETYYILSGKARVVLDEEELILTRGDSLLILQNEVHQIFNDENQDLEFLAISAPAWDIEDSFFV